MRTTLSLPARLALLVSVSAALPLGGKNRGLLLCNTGAVRDSSPHSRVRRVSQDCVCICVFVRKRERERENVCVRACRTISVAQLRQEKGHKISCPHLSQGRLSMKCFSVSESGTRECECVAERVCA